MSPETLVLIILGITLGGVAFHIWMWIRNQK